MVAYSFRSRFIEPIHNGIKTSTLRHKRRRHARVGEKLQLYSGMRTRYCKQIGTATCDRFLGVLLKFSEWPAFYFFDVMEREPGVWRRVGDLYPIADMDAFARSDGFSNFADMTNFWQEMHSLETFEGFLIGWTGFTAPSVNEARDD